MRIRRRNAPRTSCLAGTPRNDTGPTRASRMRALRDDPGVAGAQQLVDRLALLRARLRDLRLHAFLERGPLLAAEHADRHGHARLEIGRASCRERVESAGGDGAGEAE